jgi:hypothetical protein
VGAIDCTHIVIEMPRQHGYDGFRYFDRTRQYSIVVQAVTDMKRHFIDINVGTMPGYYVIHLFTGVLQKMVSCLPTTG